MLTPDNTRNILDEIAALEQEFGILGASVTVKDPGEDLTADELAIFIREMLLRTVEISDEVFAKQRTSENNAAALVL